MPTDEGVTPDELEQQQPVAPDDDLAEGTTTPDPSVAEANEADVYEQSLAVPEDPEEERA